MMQREQTAVVSQSLATNDNQWMRETSHLYTSGAEYYNVHDQNHETNHINHEDDDEGLPSIKEEELGRPVVDLGKHILRLKEPRNYSNYGDAIYDGFDLEFNHIEKQSADATSYGDYDAALKVNNRIKNRYSNVLPIESTRVVLTAFTPSSPSSNSSSSSNNNSSSSSSSSAPDVDYINANWVNGLIPTSQHAYISTQGPLQETVSDFWRMVWQTNSNVIVMLTREVENDIWKCSKYWPNEEHNFLHLKHSK